MQLASFRSGVSDPVFKRLVVVFNCSPLQQRLPAPPLATAGPQQGDGRPGGALRLHPAQAAFGFDARTSSGCKVEVQKGDGLEFLVVPARTTAVFVQPYL